MKVYLSAVALVALLVGTVNASVATSRFFVGEDNLGSDNDAEYLIDLKDPLGRGASFIDPGDLLIGAVRFSTVEDLTGGGGTRSFGLGSGDTVDEFVAMFASKVLTVAPVGKPTVTATLGPVTPADTLAAKNAGKMSAALKAHLDAWMPGTMVATYNDPAKDFTRTFTLALPAPDDGDPGLTGADAGAGPFVSEETLLKTAYDWTAPGAATPLFEIGFTGADTDADGAPNAKVIGGTGEGWSSTTTSLVGPGDDIKGLRAVPAPTNAGTVNFGLNTTANSTSIIFVPVPTLFGGTADFSGSTDIKGLGSNSTPYDLFSNTDVVFHPTPEPGSVIVWSLLLAGAAIAIGRSRRRRVA